jgi:CheY-like chemotaxis protein
LTESSSPSGRVLIVEDDPLICETVGFMLEEAPLSAVCVHTDTEAYAQISTRTPFRAIVLDINLGKGTTGFDVARFARRVFPNIAVIYMSGSSNEDSFRAFGVPGSAFLLKPFNAADLIAALEGRVVA